MCSRRPLFCRSEAAVQVYPASKAHHAEWWRALRAAGVPISANWIDGRATATARSRRPPKSFKIQKSYRSPSIGSK
jgi:hypothetical protein